VIGLDGNPWEGARIRIRGSNGSSELPEVVTDSDGRFQSIDTAAGNYSVTLLGAPEGSDNRQDVDVEPGSVAEANFDFSGDVIVSGVIRNNGMPGFPVAGGSIRFASLNESGAPDFSDSANWSPRITPGSDGSYTATLKPGSYRVQYTPGISIGGGFTLGFEILPEPREQARDVNLEVVDATIIVHGLDGDQKTGTIRMSQSIGGTDANLNGRINDISTDGIKHIQYLLSGMFKAEFTVSDDQVPDWDQTSFSSEWTEVIPGQFNEIEIFPTSPTDEDTRSQ